MSRLYTVGEKLLTVLQGSTQARVAKKLGVSIRTIRRWKNEGVAPSSVLGNDKKLARAASNARKSIRRRAQYDEFPYEEPDLSVPPRGARRDLDIRDQRGRPTGVTYKSDWVNYNVRKWSDKQIFDLLVWGREHEKTVQFIYLIPVGSKYKNSRGYLFEHPGVMVISRNVKGEALYKWVKQEDGTMKRVVRRHLEKRAIHGGTIPRLLTGYSDTDLWEAIENITRHDLAGKRHPILYVGFLEPGRPGRAPRALYQPKRRK